MVYITHPMSKTLLWFFGCVPHICCKFSFANLGDPFQLCELSTFCESQGPFKSVPLSRTEISQSFSHLCRFIVTWSEGEASREQREKNHGDALHMQNRGFVVPLSREMGYSWSFRYLCLCCSNSVQQLVLASTMGTRERRRKWDFPSTLWLEGVPFPGMVVRKRDVFWSFSCLYPPHNSPIWLCLLIKAWS